MAACVMLAIRQIQLSYHTDNNCGNHLISISNYCCGVHKEKIKMCIDISPVGRMRCS
jgi:hypothetical protein